MELAKIIEEYERDVIWEFSKMDKYIQALPMTVQKYQGYWFTLKRELDKIDDEYDDKWMSRYIYYKNDFDIKLSSSEIKDFLSKDLELNKLKKKQRQLISSIEYLEKCLKNLDNIRWDISRCIDFEKFKSGAF